MSTFPNRELLKRVLLLAILLPQVSLSQVKIKEKVEIQPKPPTQMKQLAGVYNFFAPPLFIPDDCTLPLKSKLFITGAVSVSDDIGYGQSVEVGYVVHDYFNPSVIYDTPIAWKGRNPVPAGGNLFEGQKTDTLTLDAGTTPDVELLLWRSGFDGFGTSQVTGGVSELDFSFTGTRTKIDGSTAAVGGTARATGSVLPTAAFNSWKIQGWTYLWCGDHAPLTITPLDSSGAQYSPAHSEMMSGTFTVSVQAKGDYAYLQYDVQEGRQVTVTIPQQNTIYLVLDTQRGYIPDDVDTAVVTVTGGGRSKSMSFILECEKFDHLAIVASSDTLLDGSSVSLKVVAQDVNNQEITPPAGLNVRLELYYQGGLSVDGSTLAHDTTISYDVAHSGKVRYVAPDSSDDGMECGNVWIDVYRAEDGDKWNYTDLTFAKGYCAKVIVNPSKLAPGETATVTFEKTGGEDMFDVAILTNDTSRCGKLVSSSGASGIALQADRGTVQYVAPASVTGDSIVMSIKASSYGICGGIFIHGIVSDVSKNTPGLASTQSLKKKSSLSKGKSLTSLKKVVRQRVAQPLSKQDQKMIMLSVAKRVADNTCPLPTQVVVENDQLVDCTKASEPRTAEARKDGKGCTPQLGERPPASASGNDDGITFEIEVCRDVNFKQPRVRPKQAYFPFFYGLCKKNIEDYPLTLKNIEDVVPGDTATACSMKRQLKVRMADRLQGNGGYWPGTFVTESELIAHEKAHLPQWREIFKEAYSNLLQSGKYLITPSDAEDIKNDSQKRNAWVGKMVTDVVDLAKGIESDRHQSDERAANIRQGKELSTLVKSLQKSYPTCK